MRALVQQRENFVQQQSDDLRRIKTASADLVKPLLQSHIDYLSQAIKSIEKLIRQSAKNLDSDKAARLCSVKGIGLVTAASLMAYLPELGEVGRHEIAALAGIAPYNDDSGKHKGLRHIERGKIFRSPRDVHGKLGRDYAPARVSGSISNPTQQRKMRKSSADRLHACAVDKTERNDPR